ncbi:hypothetical protein DS745_21010 [Anaerobacillus alkaliphilus]|uniref:Uncharacterized protein n=1 Tax=Anaerobacillus alkaliphilus TaxID=1548597 RepID=A0A4Q0VMF2_9BACI|nr:hypothetical protein [Anaerobacillus alkaliphilus]RXI96224.1 hypothetical protein DS745_21010 [Anaerobacillus alkaliphilus]
MRSLSIHKPIERKLDEAYTKWGKSLGLQQHRYKRMKKLPIPNLVPFESSTLEPLRRILSMYSHGAIIVTDDEHPYFTMQALTYSGSSTRITLKSELHFCKDELRYYSVLVVQQFNLDQWEKADTVMNWLRDHGGNLGFEKLVYQCLGIGSPREAFLARINGLREIHNPFVQGVVGIQRVRRYDCYLEKNETCS